MSASSAKFGRITFRNCIIIMNSQLCATAAILNDSTLFLYFLNNISISNSSLINILTGRNSELV